MTRQQQAAAAAHIADYLDGLTQNQEEAYAILNSAQSLAQYNHSEAKTLAPDAEVPAMAAGP